MTTAFQALVASCFKVTGGVVDGAVRTITEAMWEGQIVRQLLKNHNVKLVGVDSIYTYSNIGRRSLLYIGGVVFRVDEIRGLRSQKIFMLHPMVGTRTDTIERGIMSCNMDGHFPSGKKVKECSDFSQALSIVTEAKVAGHDVTLFTDGAACSEMYYEDYTNASLGDLFDRILALRKQPAPELAHPWRLTEVFRNLAVWDAAAAESFDEDY